MSASGNGNGLQKKFIPVSSDGFVNFNLRMPATPSSISQEKRNLNVGFNPFNGINSSKYGNVYTTAGNPFNNQMLSNSSNISNAQKGMLGNRRINSQVPAAINEAGNRPTTNRLGDPLFVIDGLEMIESSSKAQGYNVFTLQQLNLHLRKAAEAEHEWILRDKGITSSSSSSGKLLHEKLPDDQHRRFVSYLKDYADRVKFIGVQYTDSDVSSAKLPLFRRAGVYLIAYIAQGRQQMFNYWGDLCAGAKVGFLVRTVGGENQIPYLKVFPSTSLYSDYGSNYLGGRSIVRNMHELGSSKRDRGLKRRRGIFSKREAFSVPDLKNDPLKEKYGEDCDIITCQMLENPKAVQENFGDTIIEIFRGYRNYMFDVPDSQLYDSTQIESTFKFESVSISENENQGNQSFAFSDLSIGKYIPIGVVESGAFGGVPTKKEIRRNCDANDDNSPRDDFFNKTIYIDLIASSN